MKISHHGDGDWVLGDDKMAHNVLDVRIVFNSGDLNKKILRLIIKLIRGVISVEVI